LTRANIYFKNIGLQFHLLNDLVQHVHNDKYLDAKIIYELELRQQYDQKDVINLYFVKSISRENGSILNGYSNLASLKTRSNMIILSFQDNHIEDCINLKDKTLL
jgi:hypothetical protein